MTWCGMTRVMTLLVAAMLTPVAAAETVRAVVGWIQRVDLGMPVSGVIESVAARPGQRVTAGDVLVRLDGREFDSRVQRWQAEHRAAQSVLAEARREDERAAELYDRTLLSDFERNQAKIALDQSLARVETTRSALVEARLARERSAIKAPFDGVVLAVNAVPGQTVVSELQVQPLVTLGDDRRLQARAELSTAQLSGISPGDALSATSAAGPLAVTVAHVGFEPVAPAAADPRYELVVEFDAGQRAGLRVGQSIDLTLE